MRRAAHFALRPSPRLAAAGLLAHVAAALAVLGCEVADPVLRMALALLLAVSLRGCWRAHVARSDARAVCALAHDRRGWQIQLRTGERLPVTPCPGSLVHPLLTVLSLRDRSGRRHAAIVLEEMLDPSAYRRLRALLRERDAGDGGR